MPTLHYQLSTRAEKVFHESVDDPTEALICHYVAGFDDGQGLILTEHQIQGGAKVLVATDVEQHMTFIFARDEVRAY